jgi:transcriptional regulator with XRE-family HTH domain
MAAQYDDNPKSLLGALLRAARQQGPHRTQEALAEAAGIERSGLTRMEAGDRVPHLATLAELLAACEVTGLARTAIEFMWRLARRADDPATARVAPWYEVEPKAHTLRFWQPIIIPGLLQTEKYAYEMYRAMGRGHDRAKSDTDARMARQAILSRGEDGPTVVVVLDELVLNRPIGTAEVMAEQCARLLTVAENPSVMIHVLPSSLGASPGLGGSVSLASLNGEPDVLLTGSMLEDVVTTEALQVRAASSIFERVRGRAASTDGSKVIIGKAQERWTA